MILQERSLCYGGTFERSSRVTFLYAYLSKGGTTMVWPIGLEVNSFLCKELHLLVRAEKLFVGGKRKKIGRRHCFVLEIQFTSMRTQGMLQPSKKEREAMTREKTKQATTLNTCHVWAIIIIDANHRSMVTTSIFSWSNFFVF